MYLYSFNFPKQRHNGSLPFRQAQMQKMIARIKADAYLRGLRSVALRENLLKSHISYYNTSFSNCYEHTQV